MTWLTLIPTFITCAIGAAYFFDKYFGSRRAGAQDSDIKTLKGQSWSLQERLELERRLVKVEADIALLNEVHELKERIAANILRRTE